MILLVLRPEPGAAATAARARAIGFTAVVAPLFTIRPIAPPPDPTRRPEAVLLTSANAVRALGTWTSVVAGLPVYAVGAATAQAARAAHFAHVIVGHADAATIVARAVQDGVRRLLHLCGRDHRAVAHPDVAIEHVVVYAADPVPALPVAAADALARGAVALLHSPRAAARFGELIADRTSVAIAAISPAALAAAGTGWRATASADAPTDAALLVAAARLCQEAR